MKVFTSLDSYEKGTSIENFDFNKSVDDSIKGVNFTSRRIEKQITQSYDYGDSN